MKRNMKGQFALPRHITKEYPYIAFNSLQCDLISIWSAAYRGTVFKEELNSTHFLEGFGMGLT